MKTVPLTICVLLSLFLAGCVAPTQKTLQATGGSRADGTIDLSYEFGVFESPVVNWYQGLNEASDRCRAWGYRSAEKFGGTISQCLQANNYGTCMRTLVTVTYQCIGEKNQ